MPMNKGSVKTKYYKYNKNGLNASFNGAFSLGEKQRKGVECRLLGVTNKYSFYNLITNNTGKITGKKGCF